jgi:hypothetical protein
VDIPGSPHPSTQANLVLTGFEPGEHLELVQAWLKKRGLPETEGKDLPQLGIVVLAPHPIAVGFLRVSEGQVGMLDSYVTDPDALPWVRNQALELLTRALIDIAKTHGFSRIFAFSVDKNTLVRAETHGFVKTPYTVMGLTLSQGVKDSCPL